VRRYQITTTGLLGAMVDFLVNQPAQANEAAHSLRSVVVAPYGANAVSFAERFGVPVYTEYNMSELSVPLWAGPTPAALGTCGQVAEGYVLRLVDSEDRDVPVGAVGELVLQTQDPGVLSHGYLHDDAATAQSWRGGWFHTGDLFRRDALGFYYFVDRATDSIRRRGENISAFEVEAALRLHANVLEAVAIAVPSSQGSDQEVMAVLIVREPSQFEAAAYLEFLRAHLAPHMLPRYIRVVTELPRTPTQKIEKYRLRSIGVTPDTWDRELAGVKIRADVLERRI
jgi:carnitine-CoA ligase